jgi:hypothetical protein
MNIKKFGTCVAALLLTSVFSVNINAANFEFDFFGECDDCAFFGNPVDADFDPFDDGLTESVSGSLILTGLSVDSNGLIEYGGNGTATFSYKGSSLINPFTISDPFLFTHGLMESGEVQSGSVFTFSSSQNVTDPGNPLSFDFPSFCTGLGQQVLGFGCSGIGLVSFDLDSAGNWSIFGEEAFDIGGSGQLVLSTVPVPAAVWLFGTALIGLVGFGKRKAAKT